MLLCIISFLGYRVLIRGFRRASRSILLSFSCSALQASLLPSKKQANASFWEASENRVCQVYILSLLGYNIYIPSPTPPFGKGRGLVADKVCSVVVLKSLYVSCFFECEMTFW